ncbi:MAG: sulfite exporter TauE/SafE family protein [Ruminococcaceae bacterium]|nr:sulfite exporter TauE/SafE family protein [Oscillospiraceae bacterium]
MNIIVGLLSGVAASMGLGGGFVLLIYLSLFTNTNQAIAQGVNILFFLPIALLSVCIHLKNKLIDVKTVIKYSITGLIGAAAGSLLSVYLDTEILRKLFAVFLILIGLRELFTKKASNTKKQPQEK